MKHSSGGTAVAVLLLHTQAALGEDQQDTPSTIKAIMRLEVKKMATELQDSSGKLLMQAAMQEVDSRVVLYPHTQDVTFCVAKVCAAPSMQLLSTCSALVLRTTLIGLPLAAPCSSAMCLLTVGAPMGDVQP